MVDIPTNTSPGASIRSAKMRVRKSNKVPRYASSVYTSYPGPVNIRPSKNTWNRLWSSLADVKSYRRNRAKSVNRIHTAVDKGKTTSSDGPTDVSRKMTRYPIRNSVSTLSPNSVDNGAVRVVRDRRGSYGVVVYRSTHPSIPGPTKVRVETSYNPLAVVDVVRIWTVVRDNSIEDGDTGTNVATVSSIGKIDMEVRHNPAVNKKRVASVVKSSNVSWETPTNWVRRRPGVVGSDEHSSCVVVEPTENESLPKVSKTTWEEPSSASEHEKWNIARSKTKRVGNMYVLRKSTGLVATSIVYPDNTPTVRRKMGHMNCVYVSSRV